VKNTVMASAAIVVIGCAFTMMTTAVLNIRHTHKMMKGNEDLRGSARWATKEDILRDTSLLTASDGVYIGGFHSDNRLHYLMHSGKEHFLAFAPTRSGKGVGLVIPTLLVWPDRTGPKAPASAPPKWANTASNSALSRPTAAGSTPWLKSGSAPSAKSPMLRTSLK
jgi:type IV secretory pathway TraG/TraD family ATPase VirD4